ncbi:MAG: copper chaperone PCu(A)C [Melioribacter sp.]|uniref:copper chaperone PCu(A)C n=1 Tax=Rosettibacter primus TaxID=3111523 RepID=UPI00247CA1BD|nr:copper chaperone PCu(A)C [Melioribacter sp.]
MKHIRLFLLGISIILTNSNYSQTINIKDAWARVSAKGSNSAVYFKITNNSAKNDTLISAESNSAEVVEIHETFNENNKMGMRAVKFVEIPAKSEVNFKPGGLHIMLINLIRNLKNNDTINLVLKFKHSKEIKMKVPVKDAMNSMKH